MKLQSYGLTLIQGGALVGVWFASAITQHQAIIFGAIVFTVLNVIVVAALGANGYLELPPKK